MRFSDRHEIAFAQRRPRWHPFAGNPWLHFRHETLHINAPFDTRLGRLQRGLGAGFLHALAEPRRGAAEVLLCIKSDPRLNPQQESRAPYYADLVCQLGIEVEPIVEHASQSDQPWLAIDVLAELAGRQDPVALKLLAEPSLLPETTVGMLVYLRDFPEWSHEHLSLKAVALLAEHLHDGDDLVYDVDVAVEFWDPWRTKHPLIEQAFVDAAAAAAAEAALSPELVADPSKLTTDELLEGLEVHLSDGLVTELNRRASEEDRALLADAVMQRSVPAGIRAAARTLGGLGDLRLLAVAEELFALPEALPSPEQRSRRAAMLWYFTFLPPEDTLHLAREWWPRGGFFRIAAGRVLAKNAEASDRVWIEEFLGQSLPHGSGELWVNEIDALAHISDQSSVSLLTSITDRVTYTWARTRALRALAKITGTCRSIEEALWDCEADAREIGCRLAVSGTAVASRRLRELAGAALEDEVVRELAAERVSADDLASPE